MLNRITIRNFKRFSDDVIELGHPVVFIGPNNSGKSTALQALALWDTGLKRWLEKRMGKDIPASRSGVTINRNDLFSMPVPQANLLWRDMHTRETRRDAKGAQSTENIRIELLVEGITGNEEWRCGLEFDYGNVESIYCRPLRLEKNAKSHRMVIPEQARDVNIAYLPPMSGLNPLETLQTPGAVNVLVGEGRTAEVLRNLCYSVFQKEKWGELNKHMENLFGVFLQEPQYIGERGELRLQYKEKNTLLDISSSGRGLQQTLLLLAYMYNNPDAVLLLDEPDAHLESLRQRNIYQLLVEVAADNGNQIIAASHSEVLLREAAEKNVVVAFVGKPHRMDDRGNQVAKSLTKIGFEEYYQAELKQWILFLEGATDLAILQAFARRLGHEQAVEVLRLPYVHYVAEKIKSDKASEYFFGLKEAVPSLLGIAIYDNLGKATPSLGDLSQLQWRKNEIENYLFFRETLLNYAADVRELEKRGPLLALGAKEKRIEAMQTTIGEFEEFYSKTKDVSFWDEKNKASELLEDILRRFHKLLGIYNEMSKKNFHILAEYVPVELIDPEVREKLDAIVEVARQAEQTAQS